MPNRFSNRRRKIRSAGKHSRIDSRLHHENPNLSPAGDNLGGEFPKIKPGVVEPRQDRVGVYCLGVRPGDARWNMCERVKRNKKVIRERVLNRDLINTVHPERLKRSRMTLREKQRYWAEKSAHANGDYERKKMVAWSKLDSNHLKSTQIKRTANNPVTIRNLSGDDDTREHCPTDHIFCGWDWFENPGHSRQGGAGPHSETKVCCHIMDYECRNENGCMAGGGRGRDR